MWRFSVSRRTLIITVLLSLFMAGATHSMWGQTTGTIVVNFSITVDATISSTAGIGCHAAASVSDGPTGAKNLINEAAGVLATRTGSTASCTVNIPYSWNLVTPTTDKVILAYSITAPAEVPPGSPSSLPTRVSEQTRFAAISVPASGSITTENLTVTF
jgi:hypothetical protein